MPEVIIPLQKARVTTTTKKKKRSEFGADSGVKGMLELIGKDADKSFDDFF